ncbi:5'/3'-nucleotidase SurE [Pseudomonas sp.]|uniref:5'/3'-nucleotidase SurE n=1 Tax=Pseudomonas sp. TaxID=306 RepID=UPI003D6F535C
MNKLLTGALVVVGASLSLQANALNILLTNDDGCRAPGIDAMYRALSAAGHHVTLVGPLNDSSGISAASVVIPGQALAVTELAPGKFCVGPPQGYTAPSGKTSAIGTPVDAVNVGMDVLLKEQRPDLVVSGSNFGENVGPLTQMSGTLNAALRAMIKGVPAVAVSTSVDLDLIMRDQQAGYRKTLDALDDTARFATRVIQKAIDSAAHAKGGVNVLGLPGSSGLNINFPALPMAQVKGVRQAPIGTWDRVNFTAQRGEDGSVRMNLVPPAKPDPAQQQADAYLLWQGYAVVSAVDGNRSSSKTAQAQLGHLIDDQRALLTP